MGFSLSTPYIYGGLTFSGVPEYVACVDKLNVLGDCTSLRICVIPDTTWMALTEALFPGFNIISIPEQTTSIQSLIEGTCNVIEGEQFEAGAILWIQWNIVGTLEHWGYTVKVWVHCNTVDTLQYFGSDRLKLWFYLISDFPFSFLNRLYVQYERSFWLAENGHSFFIQKRKQKIDEGNNQ